MSVSDLEDLATFSIRSPGYNFRKNIYASILWIAREVVLNFKAAITVALVNMPMSASLSLAGGGSPMSGIISAFWSGLVASIFGSSEFNIVGPTGALSGILFLAAQKDGVNILPWLAVWSGVLTLIIWGFRLIDYFLFIPNSVVHGFTLGIGITLVCGQFDAAIGLSIIHQKTGPLMKLLESMMHISTITSYASVIYFAANFSFLFFVMSKYPKYPWQLLIVAIGIMVGYLTSFDRLPFDLTTLEEKYGEIIFNLVSPPHWTVAAFSSSVLTDSITVSLVAILETLLSARMADELSKTDHDRQGEVFGVGLANIIGGIFGGVPATAALARTSLNINSGATGRVAGVLGCCLLLLLSWVLLPLFKYLPLTTIAAMLWMVAYRMIDFHHFRHLFKFRKVKFTVGMLTALMCVVVDTMAGLVTGSLLSLLLYTSKVSTAYVEIQLYRGRQLVARIDEKEVDGMSLPSRSALALEKFHTEYEAARLNASGAITYSAVLVNDEHQNGRVRHVPACVSVGSEKIRSANARLLVYSVAGQLTYVNAGAHTARTKKIVFQCRDVLAEVVLNLESVYMVDLDGIDALEEIVGLWRDCGVKVAVCGGFRNSILKDLTRHDFFVALQRDGAVFDSCSSALDSFYN